MCGSFLSKPKTAKVISTQNDDEDAINIASAVVENVIDRAKETVLFEINREKQNEGHSETVQKGRLCSDLMLDTNSSVEDYKKSESEREDKLYDRKAKNNKLMTEKEKCGDSKPSITQGNTSEVYNCIPFLFSCFY